MPLMDLVCICIFYILFYLVCVSVWGGGVICQIWEIKNKTKTNERIEIC